jgi:hypothetical protein
MPFAQRDYVFHTKTKQEEVTYSQLSIIRGRINRGSLSPFSVTNYDVLQRIRAPLWTELFFFT